MPSINKTFLDWLKSYDQRLSARWDSKKGCFIVEHIGKDRIKYPIVLAHHLDNRVKKFIIDRDMQRLGGAFGYGQTIEKMEKAKEAELDRDCLREQEAMIGEIYDHMCYRDGEVVSMYNPAWRK